MTAERTSGRNTLCSLMGSSLHRLNGLPVEMAIHLYETYTLTQATNGLETMVLSLQKLRKFHNNAHICLLGPPERTAISSLYILSRCLPMDAVVHIKTLRFLHSVISKNKGKGCNPVTIRHQETLLQILGRVCKSYTG